MGFGDEIMATGMAKGAYLACKKIAFGDGKNIIWGPWSTEIFLNNPNIAQPGQQWDPGVEWIPHYKGNRLYHKPPHLDGRWSFNPNFRPIPGEIFLTQEEIEFGEACGEGYVVVEPQVKNTAPNKKWPYDRWIEVVRQLRATGIDVVQFVYRSGEVVPGARQIVTPTFRSALAAIARSRLLIVPEGGLHHGAAAFNKPAVVIFGGFISPQITGYDFHINLFRSEGLGCGNYRDPCPHCKAAMESITALEVIDAAKRLYFEKELYFAKGSSDVQRI